jgi:multimeric flavodoxin WrbA
VTAPRILAISTSPRRGGNSETMLDAAVEGARGAGAEVEKVALADLGFRPCLNCGACSKTGRCIQKDGYTDLNEKLRAADRAVLASPIFFGSLCAQAKALIDRGQPFWAEKYVLKRTPPPRAVERRALFVSCGGFAKGAKFLASAESIVKIWLLCQDVAYAGAVFESGVDAKGAILSHPEALARCRKAGEELAAETADERR